MSGESDLLTAGVAAIVDALASGAVTAAGLTEAALGVIAAADPGLHAFITVDYDGARAAAAAADREIAAGRPLPGRLPSPLPNRLLGLPVAIKDNIPTAGLRTTFNSRAYAGWTPATDTPAVRRLRAAGAVIVGKTNLNELGWSVPSETDLVPPPRNPWRTADLMVGSSSGSAAAVAAGMVPAALGTDGGGSTRLPASQANLVGLKPGRGVIPGTGSPLDEVSVIGVLGRSAEDVMTIFSVLADRPAPYRDHAEPEPEPRLAVPRRQLESLDIEDDVRAAFEADLRALTEMGAEVAEVDLPGLETARDANFVLLAALAHAALARDLRERPELLGASARRYHLAGAVVSVEDLLNARRAGQAFAAELDRALGPRTGLLTPVSTVATTAAARRPGEHSRGLNSTFTAPFNLTGWPAISIPSWRGRPGPGGPGIPIGLQVAARPGREEWLLELASRARPWLGTLDGAR
jgi:aspartyl-tRNA(Asn)/glutamyl-tRNA(Gln) amidotransferase subunit A